MNIIIRAINFITGKKPVSSNIRDLDDFDVVHTIMLNMRARQAIHRGDLDEAKRWLETQKEYIDNFTLKKMTKAMEQSINDNI